MNLKHEIRESKTLIEKTDRWSGEIEGYDVIFTQNEINGAEFSIYPAGGADRCRLGIISCRPDNVDSLDKFAEDAPKLFRALAVELREMGKNDLRSKWEIEVEAMRESLKGVA